MKAIIIIVGVVCVLLGGLWLVQGLGLITIPPIVCVAECGAIVGPSSGWALFGLVVAAVGAVALLYGLKWRKLPARRD